MSSSVARKRRAIAKRRRLGAPRTRGMADHLPAIAVAAMIAIMVATAVSEVRREVGDSTRWSRALEDPDANRRAEALDRFSLTSDQWPVPLPCEALAERLGDGAVRDRAVPAVARVVSAGSCLNEVAAVAARDTQSATRAAAARALAFTSLRQHGLVVPRLVSWSRGTDSSATAAVVALGQLGDTSDAVRSAIEAAFEHGRTEARREAIEAISRVGSIPQLLRTADAALHDTSAEVRAAAIGALVSLQSKAEVRPTLIAQLSALQSDTAAVVRAAVRDAERQIERTRQE